MKRLSLFTCVLVICTFLVSVLNGCPKSGESGSENSSSSVSGANQTAAKETTKSSLTGTVRIDGSSTVYPITAAIAEEFMSENPQVNINVGVSGTSGGFKKFVAGEIDISDASRPIKQEEMEKLKASGIEFIELPVAYDGIAVVVNTQNTWVDYLTVEELKEIWQPDSKIAKWSDVRDGFPDEPLNCFGPGTDSGTFEYFTEAVVGEARSSRQNYTPSEDDNVLVQGVSGDKGGIGYFGYAYYAENMDKLKLVPVKYKENPVLPSPETINNGTYQPLSRPVFIYVSTKAIERPEVNAFVEYYLKNGSELITEVGYVPLPSDVYEQDLAHFNQKVTGTMFGGKGAVPGIMLLDLMRELKETPQN